MRNNFGSYIATTYTSIPVHQLLSRLESGRIELYSEYNELVRFNDMKRSQIVESFLLGLPSNSLWVEQEHYGSSTILEGAEIAETLWLFVNNEFSLKALRYFSHLNGYRFGDLSHYERDGFLSTEILLREIKYDAHPRLKCEFYRSLHHDNRQKNVSQIARGYAFKRAYQYLKHLSSELDNIFILSMIYKDSRDKKKNEAKIHEFLLSITLMLYINDVGHLPKNSRFDEEFLNDEIYESDTIEIALDKMMMLLDLDESRSSNLVNKIISLVEMVYRQSGAKSVNVRSVVSYSVKKFHNKSISLDEILNDIHKEIFGFSLKRNIFENNARSREYNISELFK